MTTSSTELRTEVLYPFLPSLLAVDAGRKLEFSLTGIAIREVSGW